MTEEVKVTVISAVLSLIVAVITAIATSKLTLKQDVKKRIHQKQEEAYISCFDLLQALKDNPYLVFNYVQFYKPFCTLRTKLNLFASKEVVKTLEPLYRKIVEIFETYQSLFDGEEYEMRNLARAEQEGLTEADFENEKDHYMENHLIDASFVVSVMVDIVAAMRKDLGTR